MTARVGKLLMRVYICDNIMACSWCIATEDRSADALVDVPTRRWLANGKNTPLASGNCSEMR
jgi:hypothetical protein